MDQFELSCFHIFDVQAWGSYFAQLFNLHYGHCKWCTLIFKQIYINTFCKNLLLGFVKKIVFSFWITVKAEGHAIFAITLFTYLYEDPILVFKKKYIFIYSFVCQFWVWRKQSWACFFYFLITSTTTLQFFGYAPWYDGVRSCKQSQKGAYLWKVVISDKSEENRKTVKGSDSALLSPF